VTDDPAPAFELGHYLVDLGARRVSARPDDGRADVRLTPTEWGLLDALVRHPGKLIARQQLITDVWGPVGSEDSSSLRFYLNRLRRKLEPDPSRPRHLITEPGMGYRFQP
jgi:two-component system KDP operon response regulator KdpE